MRLVSIILMVLLFCSCDSAKKNRKKIDLMQSSRETDKYELGIACMRYIMLTENEYNYSKTLITKLLELDFSAESIYAVEILQKRSPEDADLYYLKGIGYKNLLQYELALDNFEYALRANPGNKSFTDEISSLMEEKSVWDEIRIINQSVLGETDLFEKLLNRTEKFFTIRQYDAVLYDLGSLSKMGSAADSLYFSQSVSSIYKGGGEEAVEILSGLIEYFRKEEKSKNPISQE